MPLELLVTGLVALEAGWSEPVDEPEGAVVLLEVVGAAIDVLVDGESVAGVVEPPLELVAGSVTGALEVAPDVVPTAD